MDDAEDTCRPMELPDGTAARVYGGVTMSERDRKAFAEVIAAAQRRYASECRPDGRESA